MSGQSSLEGLPGHVDRRQSDKFFGQWQHLFPMTLVQAMPLSAAVRTFFLTSSGLLYAFVVGDEAEKRKFENILTVKQPQQDQFTLKPYSPAVFCTRILDRSTSPTSRKSSAIFSCEFGQKVALWGKSEDQSMLPAPMSSR